MFVGNFSNKTPTLYGIYINDSDKLKHVFLCLWVYIILNDDSIMCFVDVCRKWGIFKWDFFLCPLNKGNP
jgi:hypothetical protein